MKHSIALHCVLVRGCQNVVNVSSIQYNHKTNFASPAWLTSSAIQPADSLLFRVMSQVCMAKTAPGQCA